MQSFEAKVLETLLRAVGDHLDAADVEAAVLVVGGAALTLGGFVDRTTQDVDVLAMAAESGGRVELRPPLFPAELEDAVRRVARDFGVPRDWFNDQVGVQWKTGLPPRTDQGIDWRDYGGLRVGLASRETILELKLVAAADGSPDSKHTQDLVALQPSDSELDQAREWAIGQDAFEGFASIVDQVIEHVRRRRDR